MADTKISAYTSVSSIDGTQEYAVNDGGTTKKATGTQQSQYTESRLQQGVLCSHASDTTCTTATWTTLAFDTETWKVGDSDIHSTSSNNSRLTAQIAGEYIVTGVVTFDTDTTEYVLQMRVRKNAAVNLLLTREAAIASANTTTRLPFSALVQLSASDYIELSVQHNKGSDLDVVAAETNFGMYLLGR